MSFSPFKECPIQSPLSKGHGCSRIPSRICSSLINEKENGNNKNNNCAQRRFLEMGVAGLRASPIAGSGWLGEWQVTNRLSGDRRPGGPCRELEGRAVAGGYVCFVCHPPGSLGWETWVPFLCLPGRWSLGEGLLLV